MNLPKLDLLEIGSNNFEMIEFTLMRQLPNGEQRLGVYGVNVAKVREVVRLPPINPLASRVPGVAGVFELRGVPIPAINLCQVLGDPSQPMANDLQVIVAEFSMKRAGFIVNQTRCIRRVEWSKVMAPSSGESSFMTGMILRDDNEFLFILDLEKILTTLELAAADQPSGVGRYPLHGGMPMMMQQQLVQQMQPQMSVGPAHDTAPTAGQRGTVLIVDDSSIIRSNLKTVLSRAGFNVLIREDGESALEFLESYALDPAAAFKIDVVISDVEMPRMDGLTLVKRLRENPFFTTMPFILHSSLSNPATRESGLRAGANAYVVKSDANALVRQIEAFLQRSAA